MNIETVISLFAIIISLVSLYQSRKNNRLSIRPYINFATKWQRNSGALVITIENKGVGPAVINDLNVHYKGRNLTISEMSDLSYLIDDHAKKVFNKDGGNGPVYSKTVTTLSSGAVISTDEELLIISIQAQPTDKLIEIMRGIEITVHYSSMYDEKYQENYSLKSDEVPTDEVPEGGS